MQINIERQNLPSFESSAERRNAALLLHSKTTVIRRALHIFCFIAACYACIYAIVQLNNLADLQYKQSSAMGMSESRLATAEQIAEYFARQWSIQASQNSSVRNEVFEQWQSMANILYVGMYTSNGKQLRVSDKKLSFKQLLGMYPNSIVASAPFALAESTGMIIIVVDDKDFIQLQNANWQTITKALAAVLIFGVVLGAYALRTLRQLLEKTRL